MKNKNINWICLFLGLTFTILIFATSCGSPASTDNTDNTMVLIERNTSYYSTWYHNETGVMYIYSSNGGFEVMVGSNGLPLIYEGYEE